MYDSSTDLLLPGDGAHAATPTAGLLGLPHTPGVSSSLLSSPASSSDYDSRSSVGGGRIPNPHSTTSRLPRMANIHGQLKQRITLKAIKKFNIIYFMIFIIVRKF